MTDQCANDSLENTFDVKMVQIINTPLSSDLDVNDRENLVFLL